MMAQTPGFAEAVEAAFAGLTTTMAVGRRELPQRVRQHQQQQQQQPFQDGLNWPWPEPLDYEEGSNE
jgi:hypothetical protein